MPRAEPLRIGSYEQYEDLDHVEVSVAVVRRETLKSFQVVLKPNNVFDHSVIVYIPKSLVKDQGLKAGQRNRIVHMPRWLWERHQQELRERR